MSVLNSVLNLQGTKGLALFYLEVKNEDGSLNNIELIQLKNKLGTRQLPTAELLLDGSVAYKVRMYRVKIIEYIEDIQMFLLNMSFISRVKWTIFIFHEWRSHE